MALNTINYSCVLCARTYVELTPKRLVACPRCAVSGHHPLASRLLAHLAASIDTQVWHRLQSREASLS